MLEMMGNPEKADDIPIFCKGHQNAGYKKYHKEGDIGLLSKLQRSKKILKRGSVIDISKTSYPIQETAAKVKVKKIKALKNEKKVKAQTN